MSEPNTAETKNDAMSGADDFERALEERVAKSRADNLGKSREKVDPNDLFSSDPLLDQLEMQVSLLTSAMTKNMVLATGVAPDLTEGELPETPKYGVGYGRPEPAERATTWAAARSIQLRDAARLSFATASLIGAYTKLKGLAPQRIAARYTMVPDPDGRKKPRKITTITHSVIASPDVSSRASHKG